jgi:hypothetical protein
MIINKKFNIFIDMKKGSQIFLLVFYIGVLQFSVKSQNNYQVINCRIAEVKSKDLLNELDSIINLEKKCFYFNDTTLFYIKIRHKKDFREIKMGSIDNCYFNSRGFSFIYKKCLFQIFSDSSCLDSNLYYVSNYWMHYTININELERAIGTDDDTRGVYDYEYKNGLFYQKRTFLCN